MKSAVIAFLDVCVVDGYKHYFACGPVVNQTCYRDVYQQPRYLAKELVHSWFDIVFLTVAGSKF